MVEENKIFKMEFSKIYGLYLSKVERKGRTKEELDQVIFWLTGYNEISLQRLLENKADMKTFINNFPNINPNTELITGSICGVKIQEIEDPAMKKIRYMDKLVDELSKGKPLDKIYRNNRSI